MCCGCFRRYAHDWLTWNCGFVVSFMILLVLCSWMASTKALLIPEQPPKYQCVLYGDSGNMCGTFVVTLHNGVVIKYGMNGRHLNDERILSKTLSGCPAFANGNFTSTLDTSDVSARSIEGQSDLDTASQWLIRPSESTEAFKTTLFPYLASAKEARGEKLVGMVCSLYSYFESAELVGAVCLALFA